MKKLESSLSNMLLVLVGFSVVIGALLAYVNHLTQGEIEKEESRPAAGRHCQCDGQQFHQGYEDRQRQ